MKIVFGAEPVVQGSHDENLERLTTLLNELKPAPGEETHAFSRTCFMTSPRFLKALAITLARTFWSKGIRPDYVASFEKWTGFPVAFVIADWLSAGAIAAERREPQGTYWVDEVRPARYAEPINAYLPLSPLALGDTPKSVIIVDDIMDSGDTARSVYRLIQKAKAYGIPVEVDGIGAIIVRQNAKDRVIAGLSEEDRARYKNGALPINALIEIA